MKTILSLLVLLLFSVIMLPSCGADTGDSLLEDKVWVLKSYGEPDNLKNVIQGTEITATFNSSEGGVTGSAGCNSYGGAYEVKDNDFTVVGPIAATEMACLDPEGVMEQETLYLQTLQSAENYQIKGSELRINCGDRILVYTTK